ncbi:hypothetical protein E2C01_092777 [Portunus trituberculatus]|uniref:Uncharacterized protein n=1 Tax=Portunus trituberculatus TaxID=210409 RepID=A0A5B7JL44_PORTR|nr:hypothetical protein [Portunus trituberculatus]
MPQVLEQPHVKCIHYQALKHMPQLYEHPRHTAQKAKELHWRGQRRVMKSVLKDEPTVLGY